MEAKLALAEFLLSSTDLQASARHATDWLVANVGVRQAAVVVADPAGDSLMLIAEHGIPSSAIADFAVSREDATQPALRPGEQQKFRGLRPRGNFGRSL